VPTPEELRLAVDRYVSAVNGRDPDAIAELFTEDAVQADPASAPPNIGRAAIASFFADGIAASESWTFSADDVHTCGSAVAVDFSISVRLGGGTMRIRGIEVFGASDDGRFASAHAYWDDADVSFT
jgi:steroid Delta-isomerase